MNNLSQKIREDTLSSGELIAALCDSGHDFELAFLILEVSGYRLEKTDLMRIAVLVPDVIPEAQALIEAKKRVAVAIPAFVPQPA